MEGKELKDFSKLLVTLGVFEELCSLVARDWLNKLLEPVTQLLYSSTPHVIDTYLFIFNKYSVLGLKLKKINEFYSDLLKTES